MTKIAKPSMATKPSTITLCELTEFAFAQAAHQIRDGYVFSATNPPETFFSGQTAITLVLHPEEADADVVAAAASTVAIALDRENAQEQRDQQAELARTKEEQARQVRQADLAAEVTAARVHLKKLEQAARVAS